MNPTHKGSYGWPSQREMNREQQARFIRNKNTRWHGKGKGR